MQLVTTVYSRDREFYIIKDENGYWGIETNKFDEAGKLKEQVNGLNGCLCNKMSDTIERVLLGVEVDYLEAQGMDRVDACIKLMKH